jgi:hypothetical protein
MSQKTALTGKPAGLAVVRGKKARPHVTASSRKQNGREDHALIAANSHCLRSYGVRCSGGTPRHLPVRGTSVWIIPIFFTSPGYGVVGEVGMVVVDAATHEVVGATPREEVRAEVARLAREKRDELEAAFHQTRKA